jgi:hypothetical protein
VSTVQPNAIGDGHDRSLRIRQRTKIYALARKPVIMHSLNVNRPSINVMVIVCSTSRVPVRYLYGFKYVFIVPTVYDDVSNQCEHVDLCMNIRRSRPPPPAASPPAADVVHDDDESLDTYTCSANGRDYSNCEFIVCR